MLEHLRILFKVPESAILWRYMDFAKFSDILSQSKLFFTKASCFQDKFEGLPTKKDYKQFLDLIRSQNMEHFDVDSNPEHMKKFHTMATIMRDYGQVSCWHNSRHESAAMWNLYAKSKESIAIETTYKRLHSAFSRTNARIFLSNVKYIDYETGTMRHRMHTIMPIVYKRKSFEHEREVRLIYWQEYNGPNVLPECDITDFGVYIDVDLKELILEVFVSPNAEPWFVRLVQNLLREHRYTCNVRQSNLYKDLIY